MALGGREGSDQLVGHFTRANEQKAHVGVSLERSQSAVNHDGGSSVPAEEVNGDPHGDRFREWCGNRRAGRRHCPT